MEWKTLLAREVQITSLAATSRRLGYSKSTLSQVLSGSYKGATQRVARRVMDVLGQTTVECPILGTIEGAVCLRHRSRKFAATNPTRVRLARTCPSCNHNPDAI